MKTRSDQSDFNTAQKKTPPEGGVLGVEAGFIQARNLSSSELKLRQIPGSGKTLFPRFHKAWLNQGLWHIFALLILVVAAAAGAQAESVEKRHGIAMHGAPALPEGFVALPYVNADAPKGGRLIMGEMGTFDSLNPYILRGRAPWAIGPHMVESLMARSYGEPFTLYGLLAESVETPDDRSWVAFTLREDARFSDGSPVTVEDVIWSYETLGTEGHPRYRTAWQAVSAIRAEGERRVVIEFSEPNRELPLLLGMRPVLKKAQFADGAFAETTDVPLIGSGPYLIDAYEPGKFIEFRLNPDWWGKDLGVNRGLNNFERVRYEYFRTPESYWEALKTGGISIFTDRDPVRWDTGYDFPAITNGDLIKGEVGNSRPTGMEGFVFNTRRPIFADRRVREALALSFDWEWINAKIYRGSFQRITSYFGGSELAFADKATAGEAALLEPFAGALPAGLLTKPWRPPVSNGTGTDRRALRRAGRLLDAAGWSVKDGVRQNAEGAPLAFEVMVLSERDETLASLWRDTLKRLGIEVTVRSVDAAQFQARRTDYDYDIIANRWSMSLSPGTEQRYYFGSDGRDRPGTRNYMGVAEPAVDAAIDAIVAARGREEFADAVKALDRVMTHAIYVIPFGVLPAERMVWAKNLRRPAEPSLYGWWGWWSGPGVWWEEPAE